MALSEHQIAEDAPSDAVHQTDRERLGLFSIFSIFSICQRKEEVWVVVFFFLKMLNKRFSSPGVQLIRWLFN